MYNNNETDNPTYYITIDPENKAPGVLCGIMNRISLYLTENGGHVELDSYGVDYTFGKMSFKLDNNPDPDTVLCYISSLPGVKFL